MVTQPIQNFSESKIGYYGVVMEKCMYNSLEKEVTHRCTTAVIIVIDMTSFMVLSS